MTRVKLQLVWRYLTPTGYLLGGLGLAAALVWFSYKEGYHAGWYDAWNAATSHQASPSLNVTQLHGNPDE